MKGALLVWFLFFFLFYEGECLSCEAGLHKQEIDALKIIGTKLKISWNFSVDPCSGKEGWVQSLQTNDTLVGKPRIRNLTCDRDVHTDICYVSSIELKKLNLTGVLPAEFANLTRLKNLDLTRNYLNGTIPAEWGSLPLVNLSLGGNRVYGRIPDEIGNISTLQSLVIEENQLEGPIPASLGKLTNLTKLYIGSNNFSGKLPESLGNLKNMSAFIMDGNPISGKIPDFIGKWTQLKRLDMQGTSLEGPFPPSFANLSSLTKLRVSDMRGFTDFPPLQNMKMMSHLVLRNLSISDRIHEYIGGFHNLTSLDLTFNNLSGNIPPLNLRAKYIYLSNNKLNGNIPKSKWMSSRTRNVDISYNDFTVDSSTPDCTDGSTIVTSITSTNSNPISSCHQRNYPCPEKPRNYKLFINCGGGEVTVDGNDYEEDSAPNGASIFHSVSHKWAMSSIGLFTDNTEGASYIARNNTVLNMSDPDLYTKARLCPLSLRYYGLCLQKGVYNVSLHFAEIIFIDNKSYFSVGKRLFDVFIQGKKVLHDFDIAKEAHGTGKKVTQSFDISVDDGTLEIHLYWAGKGTGSIPEDGVYGPLISAISVINYNPVLDSDKLSVGAISGIVVGACAAILLISIVVWICWRRKYVIDSELRGLELQTSTFTLKQIKAATNNFDNANKIGEGGFGPVYKGVLPDGSEIAVKQLSSKSKQGNREFINEIGMISALHHPNLVKLYGCGIEGKQLLLVYEYMENNSIAHALFGTERTSMKLDWKTRYKICIGIAKGLTFLHEESIIKIVHRDIKATNILLDKNLNAKISDFGLAKLDEEENTHISTRVAGTRGYMAPEYALRGYLTDKADVYSYGVVLLEVVSGMSNTSYKPKDEYTYLLDWAQLLETKGKLIELVDPKLGPNYSKEEALLVLNLCIKCTNPNPSLRPTMSTVVSILEGDSPMSVPTFGSHDSGFIYSESRTKSFTPDGLYSDSSMSVPSTNEERTFTSSSITHETSPVSASRRLLHWSDL